jgi:hypothetical protein
MKFNKQFYFLSSQFLLGDAILGTLSVRLKT